jgi:hypothetical protein
VQAGFLTYEHQGDLTDFVYSRNALHHLPDLWKALALKRIATFMNPGGILRLRDFFFHLRRYSTNNLYTLAVDRVSDAFQNNKRNLPLCLLLVIIIRGPDLHHTRP